MTNIVNAEFKKIMKKKGLMIFWAFSLFLGYISVRNFGISDSYGDLFSKFYGLAPLMGILMFSLFSGSYVLEYSSNMDAIVKSTKNGKSKLVLAKSIVYGIAASLINLSILAVMSFKIIAGTHFNGLHMSIKNIWYFGNSGSDLTVLQMLMIMTLTVILGSFLFAQLGLWLSSISQKAVGPFFIGGLVMGIPYIATHFVSQKILGFTPLFGMYSSEIIRYGLPPVAFVVFIGISILGSYVLYRLTSIGFLQER
ncbi:ABC transporter permease [Paraclostridium bifermentans]|uniref:ABC transporter permease n=1 Tax=Paraclostridium bifermentans TaxID=1490 RepID=UPI0006B34EB0|nr:ABC transporter permease [Paraclostridium bifermentans]OSB10480.1 ABC transporter permease [Paraclostridium bifermentans]